MQDGTICYIDFTGSKGAEINKIHLAVIFKVPSINELVFCIPLTSPKRKHFKSEKDFIDRNYRNVKHFNWQYLKQTDSIALLDQIKTISVNRIINKYKDKNNNTVILDNKTKKLLISKIYKYLNIVLNK